MDDNERLVMYGAFFDELEQLEKRAVMQKVAALGIGRWGAGKAMGTGMLGGFKRLFTRSPQNTVERLQKAWGSGIRSKAVRIGRVQKANVTPDDLTATQRTLAGLKGVARSSTGKALGATALGVGGLGLGAYTLGRASRG